MPPRAKGRAGRPASGRDVETRGPGINSLRTDGGVGGEKKFILCLTCEATWNSRVAKVNQQESIRVFVLRSLNGRSSTSLSMCMFGVAPPQMLIFAQHPALRVYVTLKLHYFMCNSFVFL